MDRRRINPGITRLALNELEMLVCKLWARSLGRINTQLVFSPISFSQVFASSPFSFFERAKQLAGLAGSDKHAKEMPNVRRMDFRRALNGRSKAENEMSKLRQPGNLERWQVCDTFRNQTAIPLQKLRTSFFLAAQSLNFFSILTTVEVLYR